MATALLLATLALVAPDPGQREGEASPHRQFDFWIGEWSVQNRHLNPDGTWRDGDVTRARITPVCGGMALLEEWVGDFRGGYMNGFSLRSYDPEADAWTILLSWTTNGQTTFGRMSGSFRHGRGEFRGGNTRYTFSDALPSTVRWDSATTDDGGVSWRTDWIMEFTRTRPAAEVTQQRFFHVPWNEGRLDVSPEARRLDWLVGTWYGREVDEDGNELEARLRAKHVNKGCLVVDLLEVRERGTEDWHERLTVRGLVPSQGRWEAWRLSEADPRLRLGVARPGEEGLLFEDAPGQPGARRREALVAFDDGVCRIEVVWLDAAGVPVGSRTTTLERGPD